MHNIELHIPEIEEYWYEEKIEKDPNTMSYNAGYDVSYYGYNYETGCIAFPKERWQEVYDKRIKEKDILLILKIMILMNMQDIVIINITKQIIDTNVEQ